MSNKNVISNKSYPNESRGTITVADLDQYDTIDVIYHENYGYANNVEGTYTGDNVYYNNQDLGKIQALYTKLSFEGDHAVYAVDNNVELTKTVTNQTDQLYCHISNGHSINVVFPVNSNKFTQHVDYNMVPALFNTDDVGKTYEVLWNSNPEYPFHPSVYIRNGNILSGNESYGTLTISPMNPNPGDTVTVRANLNNSNCSVSFIAFWDSSNNQIQYVTTSEQYVYQFVMPNKSVHIWFNTNYVAPCLSADTLITLADYSSKSIKDLCVGDQVLTFNHDTGSLESKPILWKYPVHIAESYNLITFEDRSMLKTVQDHRLYSITRKSYIKSTHLQVGETIKTINGTAVIKSVEKIDQPIEFSNALSFYNMNLFANGVLTGCGLNNIYHFDNNGVFVKDNRNLRTIDDYCNIPQAWFDGLRLSEQYAPIDQINNYVQFRLENAES